MANFISPPFGRGRGWVLALSNLSPATIAAYLRIVRTFRDWHAAQFGGEPDLAAIEEDVIERYLRWSRLRVSEASCRKRRAALHWARAIGAHTKESQ